MCDSSMWGTTDHDVQPALLELGIEGEVKNIGLPYKRAPPIVLSTRTSGRTFSLATLARFSDIEQLCLTIYPVWLLILKDHLN